MSRTIKLQAGAPQEFFEVSNFLRVLEADGPLTITYFWQGRELAEAVDVSEGYAEKFEAGQFDRVRLVSANDQTVQFVQRLGNTVQYDKAPVGDVNVLNTPDSLRPASGAGLSIKQVNGAWGKFLDASGQRASLTLHNTSSMILYVCPVTAGGGRTDVSGTDCAWKLAAGELLTVPQHIAGLEWWGYLPGGVSWVGCIEGIA